jgi:tetratricopeptide (TPR) repeat protein
VTSVGVSHEQDIQSRPAGSGVLGSPQKQKLVLSVLLIVATVVLYYPAENHPFVNYDDNLYVTENAHVTSGLHWETLKWAFTTFDEGNWHPLTWLSHAADVQFYGLNPAGHHDTNLFLHVLNVVLLFWVLQQATGYIGRSAMVAALFALHPINVETVVWIAERKNLLSMTFLLLALGAYRRYALKPDVGRYSVVALLFALGLMAKPQVITLPFVLLLWDYWPLRRISFAGHHTLRETETADIPERTFSQIVLEKFPLFALSAVSAVITVKAQRAGHAFRLYPLSIRLENAVVAYASYIKKAVWPVDLAPMYPHPGNAIATRLVLAALLFLLCVTALVVAEWRRRRSLAVGWLWFLGTLVPMIGLVQVGTQAMADRYAYLPLVGLFIMVCWSVAEWAKQRQISHAWLRGVSFVGLFAIASVAHQQIGYWEDNIVLWTRTLRLTQNNWVAEDNLGGALMEQGKIDAAIPHFRAAAAIYPGDPVSHLDIGFYEQQHKNWPQAIEQYQEVLNLTPSPKLRAEAYNNLALIERDLGDYAAARDNFQRAVNVSPRYSGAWIGLGLAAQKTGDLSAAIQAYSRAVEIQASDLGYVLLAQALEQSSRRDEAQAATQQARRLSGNFAETQRTADRLLTQ